MQAGLQYLLWYLTKLQAQARDTRPAADASLEKWEMKVWKHHSERPRRTAGAKPCRKSVEQGQVSELYPVYHR